MNHKLSPSPSLTKLFGLALSCGLLAACSEPQPAADPIVLDMDGNGFLAIDDLTEASLTGSWSSTGGSCDTPDLVISRDERTDAQGLAVAAEFNGWDRTGRIEPQGDALRFIDPRKALPIRLEEGGLHISPPPDGLAVLGSRNIFEGGVVFRKCAG